MDYNKIYDKLIEKAKLRHGVDGYTEKHHIVPRSLNGSDNANNLVSLTAREHFIAHMCLALVHGGTQWYSVVLMKGLKNRYFSSRLYETARIKYAASKKGKKRAPFSDLHKAAISNARKGMKFSESHKTAMSDARKGKTLSDSHRAAISIAQKGKIFSDSRRASLKASWVRRKQQAQGLNHGC